MTLSRRRAWLVALVATLAMSVSYIDRYVISAIATSVRAALHIDATQFGWLASAFSLAYLFGAPVAGVVVDRTGARRGLVIAILVWSAVSASHALVPSFAALFALRILLGAAEAPSFPAAAQSIRRALPAGDRSAAFGLLFTGSSLGAAVASPLAIWLDIRFGWRAAFLIASVVGLAWLPAWIAVTRPPVVRETLRRVEPAGILDVGPRVSFWELAVSPAVLRAVLLVLASAPALMMMYVWLPQYLELGRHLPKASLGRYLWLPPVMGDLGMLAFGWLASRLDRRSPTQRSHVGLVLVAASMAATLAIAPRIADTWLAMAMVGIAAAGGGGLYTLLTSDMMARVDIRRVSTAGGLTAAAQSLVYVVLNPLVGRWIDRTGSFDGPLVMLGVVALPGAVLWSVWPMAHRAIEPARS